jgi:hypothetical protein
MDRRNIYRFQELVGIEALDVAHCGRGTELQAVAASGAIAFQDFSHDIQTLTGKHFALLCQ